MSSKKKGELLPYNPLLDAPQALRPIDPDDENEQKVELIEQVESIAVLNKQVLEAKRRQVELIVDNKKLDAAQKLIDGIDLLSEKALDPVLISKMFAKDLKPLEYKLIIESIQKLSMTLKDVMNSSVQDEFGKRKRTKIVAAFQTAAGDKMMVSTEGPSND